MTPFIGQVCLFGFNFAPNDWQMCEGQLVPVTQNPSLYSLIGTYYGGDGRTTFALPDLRGRMPIGFGNGPGLDPVALGQRSGQNSYALTVSNLPAHSHGLQSPGIALNAENATNSGKVLSRSALNNSNQDNLVPLNISQTESVGGSGSFSLMNPFQALNFCIAMDGIYPPRP